MKRNFICHILPRSRGQKWRNTVNHILKNWDLFNGKKVISVSLDDQCDSIADVKDALGEKSKEITWLRYVNNPCLREVISFRKMLETVASYNPDEYTFCFHGKGSTHGHDDSICHCWGDVMWEACMAWPLVECLLKDKAICGSFRTCAGNVGVPWHFSGTFYWIKHDRTFPVKNWCRITQDPFGTESWPGLQFEFKESSCLFMDHCGDLYDENYWGMAVFPALRFWQDSLRRCGLSMTDYSPPDWFLQRHPNFRVQNGQDGSVTTVPERKNLPRTREFLNRVLAFSKR